MFQTMHLIVAFTAFTNPYAWGMEPSLQEKIEMSRKTFEEFLETTKSRFTSLENTQKAFPKFMHGSFKLVASFSAKAAGFGTIELDEIIFVRRLFEDDAKKQKELKAFLENHAHHRGHLVTMFQELEKLCPKDKQADAQELLVNLLHKHTVTHLKQPASSTRLEMTNKVLAKDQRETYLVSDENYFPLVLVNLFATHVFERFYKK